MIEPRTVRDDMSQSPRGISPTDRRVDYLVKAKAARQMKNEHRRKMSHAHTPMGTRDPLGPLIIKKSRNDNASSNMTSFGGRKMTLDLQSMPPNHTAMRMAGGPIAMPTDMTPKDLRKYKNESPFTNSLLAGDVPGYAHMHGGSKPVQSFSWL